MNCCGGPYIQGLASGPYHVFVVVEVLLNRTARGLEAQTTALRAIYRKAYTYAFVPAHKPWQHIVCDSARFVILPGWVGSNLC